MRTTSHGACGRRPNQSGIASVARARAEAAFVEDLVAGREVEGRVAPQARRSPAAGCRMPRSRPASASSSASMRSISARPVRWSSSGVEVERRVDADQRAGRPPRRRARGTARRARRAGGREDLRRRARRGAARRRAGSRRRRRRAGAAGEPLALGRGPARAGRPGGPASGASSGQAAVGRARAARPGRRRRCAPGPRRRRARRRGSARSDADVRVRVARPSRASGRAARGPSAGVRRRLVVGHAAAGATGMPVERVHVPGERARCRAARCPPRATRGGRSG